MVMDTHDEPAFTTTLVFFYPESLTIVEIIHRLLNHQPWRIISLAAVHDEDTIMADGKQKNGGKRSGAGRKPSLNPIAACACAILTFKPS